MSSYNVTRNITIEGGGGFAGPMSLFTNANGRWDLKSMVTTSVDGDMTSGSEIREATKSDVENSAMTIDYGNSTTTTAACDMNLLNSLSITAATSTRYGPPTQASNTATNSIGNVGGGNFGPGYLTGIVAVCFLSLFVGLF
jgi:hypothetical protein